MTQDQPQGEELTDFTPERWEIAIEDAAELVALLLERGQSAYEELNDLAKRRPALVSAIAAVGAGALIGTVVAGMRARQHRAQTNVVTEASAVAQAAIDRLAHQAHPIQSVRRIVSHNGSASADRQKRIAETSRSAKEAVRLVPVVVGVLKNPLVRRILWRYASRALKR
jgi:hypothetical protein